MAHFEYILKSSFYTNYVCDWMVWSN